MTTRALAAALVLAAPFAAIAGPTSLDGVLGTEWAGVTPVSVGYDPLAVQGNFGTPGTTNHQTAYDIFMRAEAQYLYVGLTTTGGGDCGGLCFANLYFGVSVNGGAYTGSIFGVEVTNDRAFLPGLPGYYNDTAANLLQWSLSTGTTDVLEIAIDLNAFTQNAFGIPGLNLAPGDVLSGIRLNLSQSFGYSVAGGATYGTDRLGAVTLGEVPEPASLALAGLALAGAAFARRRKG